MPCILVNFMGMQSGHGLPPVCSPGGIWGGNGSRILSTVALAGQIERIAEFAVRVANVMFLRIGGILICRHFISLLGRDFPESAAIGVAIFGFVILAVGLANSCRFFGLQFAVEFILSGRCFLFD